MLWWSMKTLRLSGSSHHSSPSTHRGSPAPRCRPTPRNTSAPFAAASCPLLDAEHGEHHDYCSCEDDNNDSLEDGTSGGCLLDLVIHRATGLGQVEREEVGAGRRRSHPETFGTGRGQLRTWHRQLTAAFPTFAQPVSPQRAATSVEQSTVRSPTRWDLFGGASMQAALPQPWLQCEAGSGEANDALGPKMSTGSIGCRWRSEHPCFCC